MPITVSGPDGSTFSFPDGMPMDQITSALQTHYGAPKTAPVSPISPADLARSAAGGVPIIGGLLNKANAATYAALSPLYEKIAPETAAADTTISHAPSFGERYSENLGKENARDTKFETEHPVASTAASLAGGVAATLPVAATATGARLLGLGGTTLPGQVVRGVASGAGINAADAAVRGNDPLAAAGVGGLVGGAVPVAGRVAGAIAQPIANTVRGIVNPTEEAARRVAGAIQRDVRGGTAGLTDAEFGAAQAAGAPVAVTDLGGETTRALARSAANTSPEGRALLNRTIDDRFEGQSGRLSDWLNRTFHYPNAQAQQQALDQLEQTVNRGAYQRAYAAGSGGVWSPELERLTSAPAVVDAMRGAAERGANRAVGSGLGGFNPGVTFENGIMNFRRGPTGAPVYPDLQFWDLTQRNLRDASNSAFRAGRNEEGSAIGALHRQLLNQLDTAVPAFGQARAGAARFFGAENALEAGQSFVTSRMENRQARLAVAQMSPQERQLFQDGFVDRLVRQVNESGDRRNVVAQIAQSPAARERLDIALGPQRSRELQAMLHVEGVMDLARGAVQGNSTTARQLAELGLAGGAGSILGGGNPLDPASVVNAVLIYGAARGHHAIDSRVARQVANLLASNDRAQVANGMRLIARTPNLFAALRNGDVALARAGAVQLQGNQQPPTASSGAPPPARTAR